MSPYCTDVPSVLEVNALIKHFRKHGKPTVEALGRALCQLDRNHEPVLLFRLWAEGLLTRWACRRYVGDVWSSCDFPERKVDMDIWVAAFRWSGYTADGRRAERPDTPLILYRGASVERRYGASWTDDIKLARWFASEWIGARNHPGVVWTAIVEPWRLLARNLKAREGEPEYVVDTGGLVINEYVSAGIVR